MDKALITQQEPSYDEEELEIATQIGDDVGHIETVATIVPIITLVLALVISLVIFCGIAMRKSEPKSRFVKWLREFLNFRKIWIAGILKFVYIFLSVSMTLGGIVVMCIGSSYNKNEPWVMILVGLAMITFGNIALRIGFEMAMITIGLWENTADIRGAVVKEEKKKEEKKKEEKDK